VRFFHRPGHPKANERGIVSEEDLGSWDEEHMALHAPIVMDRHYENMAATDGTDIGSRRKHREYMKRHNLAIADDFKETWAKAAKEREKVYTGEHDRKGRREDIERAWYEVTNGRR
jgi:hypothetical protein